MCNPPEWHIIIALVGTVKDKIAARLSGCYISFYHHLPIRASKVQIQWKTLARLTFLLAPKRERVIIIFVLKVVCPQYTLTCSLPISDYCYFFVFKSACLNLTFTCPGQSGKCLCSTLLLEFIHHMRNMLHISVSFTINAMKENNVDFVFKIKI